MSATSPTRARRRAGFALMDFMAGSIILAGAVTAWATLTRAQLDSVAFADRRVIARNAAARALDDARANGSAELEKTTGEPDAAGFRLVRHFAVADLPPLAAGQPQGRLEVRPLVVDGRPDDAVLEVRVVVRWRAPKGWDELEASSAVVRSRP